MFRRAVIFVIFGLAFVAAMFAWRFRAGAEEIVVEMELHVPPALVRPLAAEGERLSLALSFTWNDPKPGAEWTQPEVSVAAQVPNQFPSRVAIRVPRAALRRLFPPGQTEEAFLVRVAHCRTKIPGSRNLDFDCDAGLFQARAFVKLSVAALGGESLPLGRLFFTRYRPISITAPCGNAPALLSGKVVATQEFLRHVPPGRKLVYVVREFRAPHNIEPTVANLDGFAYHIGDLRSGVVEQGFSVPRGGRALKSRSLAAIAVVCEPGESRKVCAAKVLRSIVPPGDNELGVFRLIPDRHEELHCGQSGRVLYLHRFPPVGPGSVPRLGRERDGSLPEEIVEGAWI